MVRCGNKVHNNVEIDVHHHESVAQVRLCYARPGGLESVEEIDLSDHYEAEARAEVEAERRNERWFEDRGGCNDGFEQWEMARCPNYPL